MMVLMKDLHKDIVTIDGKRLEAMVIGKLETDAPTLVFLHAGLSSLELWKEFPQQLVDRTGLNALLYSRYGYGRSEPLHEKRAPDYLHHEGHAVLPQLLEKYGVMHPVLVGHSDGATISLLFAGRFPNRPKALILEAPHVFVEEITISGLKEAKEAYDNGALGPRLAPYHVDAEATFRGWNDIWLDPDFRSWNIENDLKTIRCPVLIIQGEDDQYATVAQVESIKNRTPATETFMIPNCRHSPHSDQPELVLARMAEFLKKVVTEA
jgi:pimeloyl-ACP methyl ester carboxylesterase